MKKVRMVAPVLAGVLLVSFVARAQSQFADSVVAFTQGTGAAAGFTNTSALLGAPLSTATPFAPAFQNTQLISMSTNGSVTVRFAQPVVNEPTHPYGLDFLIYGNSAFIKTNSTQTSGFLLGNNTGTTLVWVSQDNVTYYQLNPALTPTVDSYYPTDGSGNPSLPVNPALTSNDFAGQTLVGVRALYQGSAGGGGFDISWAQDTNGKPVFLTWIQYVRVDVVNGKSEIDAISAVATPVAPGTSRFTENFGANPAADGWQVFGDASLFNWNAAGHYVNVTWDSSHPNSFFHHSLGNVLTTNDDFTVGFSLCLTNVQTGTTPGKSFNFEIAIALFNLGNATNTNFIRGAYPFQLPSLIDCDFFPDTNNPDFSTIGPTLFFSNNDYDFDGNINGESFTSNDVFQVRMDYTASNQTLVTSVTRNGQPFTAGSTAVLSGLAPDDFRLTDVGVMSYSDAGQTGDPQFFGSVIAQGMIGNFAVVTPPPPVQGLAGSATNNVWQGQFTSRSNWLYTLERTGSVTAPVWTAVSATTNGNGGTVVLQDPSAPAGQAFYRVNAARP